MDPVSTLSAALVKVAAETSIWENIQKGWNDMGPEWQGAALGAGGGALAGGTFGALTGNSVLGGALGGAAVGGLGGYGVGKMQGVTERESAAAKEKAEADAFTAKRTTMAEANKARRELQRLTSLPGMGAEEKEALLGQIEQIDSALQLDAPVDVGPYQNNPYSSAYGSWGRAAGGMVDSAFNAATSKTFSTPEAAAEAQRAYQESQEIIRRLQQQNATK